MILRGILVAAAGFLFIFSPGLPLSLLTRRAPAIERGLIYWGLALWPLALLPALFIQTLLRRAVLGEAAAPPAGRPLDYALALAGALITALTVQAAMLLLLRSKRPAPADRIPYGLSLGFGIGLISQVFTGLGLVSSGFRLALGDLADPMVSALAQADGWGLALSLLPLILFRPALLVVSAARGLLVAHAPAHGAGWWWAAVGVDALFAWLAVVIQLALGAPNPGQITAGNAAPLPALVTSAFYLAAFGLAYLWIAGRLAGGLTRSAARAARSSSAAAR